MPPRDYESIPSASDCDEDAFNSYSRRRQPKTSLFCCLQVCGFLALAGAIATGIIVVLFHRPSDAFQHQVQQAQAQVQLDDKDGSYSVHYNTPLDKDTTTFVELAQRMLPPWYEASLRSIDATMMDASSTLTPSSVKQCRKTLLMTRNLLDAFSPVFPKHSLWAKVRKQYKKGYEVIGYYQDLNHSGVDYDTELLDERLQDVMDWKVGFEEFINSHRVRPFLYNQADPDSCTRHESSHLFWDELMELPCGRDLATSSLHRLGAVQMNHAKEYFQQMKNISSVLDEENMEVPHNMRKEVRIFMDEYDLFGDILLSEGLSESMHILDKTQKDLGHLHDDWVAYDIYVKKDSHRDEQIELAEKINSGWQEFMHWAIFNDLEGTIQSILTELEEQ